MTVIMATIVFWVIVAFLVWIADDIGDLNSQSRNNEGSDE
jgi:hypothetical protein